MVVKQFFVLVVYLSCSLSFLCYAEKGDTLARYMDYSGLVDDHSEYFITVLNLAMEKSRAKYGSFKLEPVPMPMRQDRQFKSLSDDIIDVIWTVTNKQREQIALPVRIPLLKGLIGHRVLVIHKKRSVQFAKIDSRRGLAKLTALQGHDWPDVEILERAGLKVEKEVWNDKMYKLISNSIVDYFPRSILEVFTEVELANDPTLYIEPNLLIVYPSALYFFVKKGNHALAERLEWGLRQAIEDGSFQKLFSEFPTHARALQALNARFKKVIKIANPNLPKRTPLQDKRLWQTAF